MLFVCMAHNKQLLSTNSILMLFFLLDSFQWELSEFLQQFFFLSMTVLYKKKDWSSQNALLRGTWNFFFNHSVLIAIFKNLLRCYKNYCVIHIIVSNHLLCQTYYCVKQVLGDYLFAVSHCQLCCEVPQFTFIGKIEHQFIIRSSFLKIKVIFSLNWL